MKRIILVGATDGIGKALAEHWASKGYWVTLMGRGAGKVEALAGDLARRHPDATVNGVVCDLLDASRLEPAFLEALAKTGHCDLFAFVAGVMRPTDGETSASADDREMLEVNTVAAVVLLGLAANYFRIARRGQILGVSSIAGDRGRKGNPAYNASKAALTTFLEGLRNRLHPYGVKVTTVKPGFVATKLLGGRTGLPWTASAEEAARTIAERAERGDEVFYVFRRWGLLGLALHHVPRFVFKRIGPP